MPMANLNSSFLTAFRLIFELDSELVGIVLMSLQVSLSAVACAAVIGLPLGALVGISRFPGRQAVIVLLNALMGLPPVVAGLMIYLLLSRSGPLGDLGLLFTPPAMVIAQTVLVTPIVAALTRQTLEDLHREYVEQFRSLAMGPIQTIGTLLWEGRYSLVTALLAGFGRAIAEVGAVIIVGGNIAHVTRVMTTAIALETSKGNLELALGLGIVLILIAILVNAAVLALRGATIAANG